MSEGGVEPTLEAREEIIVGEGANVGEGGEDEAGEAVEELGVSAALVGLYGVVEGEERGLEGELPGAAEFAGGGRLGVA